MISLLFILACSDPTPPTPEVAAPPAVEAPAAPTKADEEAAIERAKESAKKLGGTLKAKVVEGLAGEGPAKTLEMCSQEAQGMTALVAGETGVRVGRASTKLRNPANAGPEWVQAWLAEVAETATADIKPHTEVVDVDGTRVARFVAPIAVGEPCLACHGEPAEDVQAALAKAYPNDAATGYTAGQLRGALWAEADVTP
ncbi:MAG: DUF3365 domain-containing protein [Proteobacteria bacterium]|nr:DUF3365 domain-containing protein [Pseudomonadota bacterium]